MDGWRYYYYTPFLTRVLTREVDVERDMCGHVSKRERERERERKLKGSFRRDQGRFSLNIITKGIHRGIFLMPLLLPRPRPTYGYPLFGGSSAGHVWGP
jgi:hypothetical protein